MSAKRAEPRALLNPWCNHSWITRSVVHFVPVIKRAKPTLTRLASVLRVPYCITRRYTSRIRPQRLGNRTQRIFLCPTSLQSLSTRSRVRLSATSRSVLLLSILLRFSPPATQVGDGLEIYVVVAKGRSPQGLESMRGVQEMSTRPDGDRVFVIRRELKKD